MNRREIIKSAGLAALLSDKPDSALKALAQQLYYRFAKAS
jgi:hypothetical protein